MSISKDTALENFHWETTPKTNYYVDNLTEFAHKTRSNSKNRIADWKKIGSPSLNNAMHDCNMPNQRIATNALSFSKEAMTGGLEMNCNLTKLQ